MTTEHEIDEVLRPVREALLGIYQSGFAAGHQAAFETLMANVKALAPAQHIDAPAINYPSNEAATPAARVGAGPRAPRGLVDALLEQVLADNPGLTIDQVEDAVVAADPRVARKTIYNTLRRWEKSGKRFRRHADQRWYRIADIPAPWARVASPQGETGGAEPPVSIDDLLG